MSLHSAPSTADLLHSAPVFHPAYRAWIGAGRVRPALWRMLLGVAIIAACWILSSGAVMAFAAILSLSDAGAGSLGLQQILARISTGIRTLPPQIVGLLIVASFSGIWLGVWIAVRLLHRRGMARVLAAPGRWRWRDYAVGFAIAMGFFVFGLSVLLITGEDLPFSTASIAAWGWFLVPLFLLVGIQACGEELLLRGYIQQQLAARCRNPLVWLVLPSLIFGLLHWQPGWQGVAYVAVTTIFGLTAAVIVWRTGSLAGAMGLHHGNNMLNFTLLGPDEMVESIFSEAWLAEEATPSAFTVDGLFFLALLILVLSRWTPFNPGPRGGPAPR